MELTKDALAELIKSGAEEAVKPLLERQAEVDSKLAQAKRERDEFGTPNYTRAFGLSSESQEKMVNLMVALLRNDVAEVKLVAGTSSAAGGYLVPTDVAETIISIVPKYGVVRADSTIWPMTADTVDVPTQIASLADYWVGENQTKGGTANSDLFGKVTLTTAAHGVLVIVTEKLIRASAPNVVNFLITEMARALGKGTDYAFFRGKTVTGGTNITALAAVSGVTAAATTSGAFSTLDADDLDACIAAVDSDVLDGAAFYMNPATLWGIVSKITNGASGEYVYNPGTVGQPPSWRGFPLKTSSQIPGTTAVNTAFVYFGNMRYNLVGQRQGVTMDTAREATIVQSGTTTNLWQAGVQALKVEEGIAMGVAQGAAFAYVKSAAS
jgi:HK97 family phage major capsid protein